MEIPTQLVSFPNMKVRRRSIAARKALKRRASVFKKLFHQNTDEFCKNTTLHGLKYLTSEDLYPIERIFFALSFIAVVLTSSYFVLRVYDKWRTTPVIYSINPEQTYIMKEPFPAVTICNLNQAHKSIVTKYSRYSAEYAMMQMLCKLEVNVTVAASITNWNNLNGFIVNISQPCSDMLLSCRFGGVAYNCSELFEPIVTDEGYCCVFNMVHPYFMYVDHGRVPLDLKNKTDDDVIPVPWNSEMGYPQKLPKKFYPRTSVGTGETLGLSVLLDVDSENYYCSSSNSIGFKMVLHNPTESPNVREIGLLLAAGRETKVRIRAEKIESVMSLRSMSPRDRKCLFQDEDDQKYFTHYTQRNCELECAAKMMLKRCGCVTHFMPKFSGNETICSIYDSTCVEQTSLDSKIADPDEVDCVMACPASCYELTYRPDFFSTPLSHNGFQIANRIVKNLSSEYVEKNVALVNMYFKENWFRSHKQTEFIGITDVLSSVGGLIGLFFGFSFISLAEFIFYAMIRPYRAVRQATHTEVKVENVFNSQNTASQVPSMTGNPVRKRHKDYTVKQTGYPPRIGFLSRTLNIEQAFAGGEMINSLSESLDNRNLTLNA